MIGTVVLYIFLFIFSWFLLRWYKKIKTGSQYKLPPCLPHFPVVGSLPFIPDSKRFYVYMMKKSKTLGNVIAFYMGDTYVVTLNGREAIHEAFVKNSSTFSSRPIFPVCRKYNQNQKGLVEHPYDEEFKIFHKAYLNIFKHFGVGHGLMESRINTEVEKLIERIKLKNGEPFNPLHDVTAAVSNVVSSICFGKRWDDGDPEHEEFLNISENFARGYFINFFPILRFFPYFRKPYKRLLEAEEKWEIFIAKYIDDLVENESRENFCNKFREEISNEFSTDKLSEIDNEHLTVMIRDFTIAGTGTTTNALLWFLYLMANHQDVQNRVRNELDRVVGFRKFPSSDDKPSLPITEACILEVLRNRPLLGVATPHMTSKDSVISGVYIPAGVTVLANLYSTLMDPEVWEEPEKFKIERFLNKDATEVVNKKLALPFSIGKRSCIGEPLALQEMFQFGSAIIQQFHILPPEGQACVEAEEVIGVTNNPSPFYVRLIKRF
ncbi:hypothetical protein HELRODRAFT_78563 [Helobdella robusta]|uniref:Uncharacterized protein n=1 Tax=Helobdella robusta TaxID=6412 RepID=T1G3D0_HELRO|nr:hypothetical protein HELRODRAFT_78563 [Helobdella robusta]ESO05007.1 hypothetical protein HELRODRAFT_78563 [Helobdella robusta]